MIEGHGDDLYTHADLKRDINGNILIDDSGNVTDVYKRQIQCFLSP